MTEISLSLRCYVEHVSNDFFKKYILPHIETPNPNNSKVLAFDTETTSDEYQNLSFGSCCLFVNGIQKEFYIFYNDDLKEEQIKLIKSHGQECNSTILSRKEFVENIFIPLVYRERAKCVGFNLPFDLTRLAIRCTGSRKLDNGFSLILSENKYNPRILIKSLNSKASFIEFAKPVRKKSEKKVKHYKGYFIDLKTMTFVLTNESYSLKKALKDFNCDKQKTDVESHGKVTPEYIDYNINDTLATYDLYTKVIQRYGMYCLDKEVNQLYSPASVGKAYLEKIGIKPFSEKNPNFPREIIGYVMSTYFGGRTDVWIRKQPVKVSYIDFTSMYPTVFSLLGLYQFLISQTIKYNHTTEQTQNFLNLVKLDDIVNVKTWKSMTTICKIKPDGYIVPIRTDYGNKHTTNIGINHLKSTDDTTVWYTLPDLIASKLLSGKTPTIEDAITFTPDGIQSDLKGIEILKGITVKPEEDFIQKLIEERLRIKKESKSLDQEGKKQSDLKQNILKIIANATSYGIFIQVDTTPSKKNVTVYGLNSFNVPVDKIEKEGKYFNPIMSVFITSTSRLILAVTEVLIKQNQGYFAYCDTDSVFISPQHVRLVQEFFKPLNPYTQDTEMFKIEEYKDSEENKHPLDNVWFYGISAKRYVLYGYNSDTEEITIFKHSAHGLGHLDGIDQEQWWKDILTIHYNPEFEEQILSKYQNKYAISQITVTTYDILSRFDKINKNKYYKYTIKPFNFATVGTGYQVDIETGEPIIPFLPKVDKKRYDEVPFMPFVDYKTGISYPNENSLDTRFYWRTLSEVMRDYINHRESKSEGDVGFLKRKYLTINKSSISYIGKESNELEESEIIGVDDDNYTEYDDIQSRIVDRIANLTLEDCLKLGLSRRSYFDLQNKIKKGIRFSLKKKTMIKLFALNVFTLF